MTESDTQLVLAQSQAIIDAEDLLRTPVKELTPEAGVTAWQILDLLEKKLVGPRKAELRETLLQLAEEAGGKATIAGASVKRVEVSGRARIDLGKLRKLLQDKGLEEDSVIVEKKTTTYSVDEKALEAMIASGLIDEDDLKAFTEVSAGSIRLNVKKSKEVLALLEG